VLAFWQDDKVKQVYTPLISQVAVCTQQEEEGKVLLQNTLSALVDNATDDVLLKSMNVDLLMHTRSEDVQVRLFALVCSKTIWQAHGGKLLGKTSLQYVDGTTPDSVFCRFRCRNFDIHCGM
jgi:U3 small nucleolar RNA-associated protein 10